jgi:DNA-directed RNA polymerase specialized sigma24 family protein
MEAAAATAAPPVDERAARSRAGEQQADALLVEPYLDDLYDFVLRVVRDRVVAAGVLRDVFAKASEEGVSAPPKAWAFGVARESALETLRARKGLQAFRQPDREGMNFTKLEVDRLADPSAVLFDRELVELVWDSVAALAADDYSLLDLHLRRDFTTGELAAYLELEGADRLSRLCTQLNGEVAAALLATRARTTCVRLDLTLSDLNGASTKERSRLARAHARVCSDCKETADRFVSATEVFSGLAVMPPPAGLRAELRPNSNGHRRARRLFGIL